MDGIDIIYHLAANVTTPFANTDPHFYEQVNHWGTAELAYAAEKASVKKLIYSSSTSVYGASSDKTMLAVSMCTKARVCFPFPCIEILL